MAPVYIARCRRDRGGGIRLLLGQVSSSSGRCGRPLLSFFLLFSFSHRERVVFLYSAMQKQEGRNSVASIIFPDALTKRKTEGQTNWQHRGNAYLSCTGTLPVRRKRVDLTDSLNLSRRGFCATRRNAMRRNASRRTRKESNSYISRTLS